MGISISKEEQEITIQASRNQKFANVYVTDRTYMTKLDKMVEKDPQHYKVTKEHKIQGEVIGKTYQFPKKLISFRNGSVVREMSEEQKKKVGEGLVRWRQEEQRKKMLSEE